MKSKSMNPASVSVCYICKVHNSIQYILIRKYVCVHVIFQTTHYVINNVIITSKWHDNVVLTWWLRYFFVMYRSEGIVNMYTLKQINTIYLYLSFIQMCLQNINRNNEHVRTWVYILPIVLGCVTTVSAYERLRCICNVFSHWPKRFSWFEIKTSPAWGCTLNITEIRMNLFRPNTRWYLFIWAMAFSSKS